MNSGEPPAVAPAAEVTCPKGPWQRFFPSGQSPERQRRVRRAQSVRDESAEPGASATGKRRSHFGLGQFCGLSAGKPRKPRDPFLRSSDVNLREDRSLSFPGFSGRLLRCTIAKTEPGPDPARRYWCQRLSYAGARGRPGMPQQMKGGLCILPPPTRPWTLASWS